MKLLYETGVESYSMKTFIGMIMSKHDLMKEIADFGVEKNGIFCYSWIENSEKCNFQYWRGGG